MKVKMLMKGKLRNKMHQAIGRSCNGSWYFPHERWDAKGSYHGKHSQGKINACHTSKEANNPSQVMSTYIGLANEDV